MAVEKCCSFYRSLPSRSMWIGVGYCDLDCRHAMCNGEVKRCEKLDALRNYLVERKWVKGSPEGGGVLSRKEF